jgi:hypothetical protein
MNHAISADVWGSSFARFFAMNSCGVRWSISVELAFMAAIVLNETLSLDETPRDETREISRAGAEILISHLLFLISYLWPKP